MKIISNLILILTLTITIKTNPNISESNKEKVRACISIQQKKYEENEKAINEFINNKSDIYKQTPNKILLLAMAYCYDKISVELAKKINRINTKNINIASLGIEDLYNFEKYNYDDQEMNKKIYDNFFPTFYVVYKEITDKEKKAEQNNHMIYFVHTPLFKFYVLYTIINFIIVFYKRLKDPSKYIDFTSNYENKKKDEEEDEINDDNNNNTHKKSEESNNENNRKLKKKNRLGKNKNN